MTEKKLVDTLDNALPHDLDLDALVFFIEKSLAGSNNKRRELVADKAYRFTVYTVWGASHIASSQVVQIKEGQKLYFFGGGRDDTTDVSQFVINEDSCGWSINTETGAVRYFDKPVDVSDKAFIKIYDLKVKRLSSRRK